MLLRTAFNRRILGAGMALLVSVPPVAPASTVPVIAISSVNWSGYALAGNDFTAVTGTFNVPVTSGPASCVQQTAVWVGVDGLRNHDLLQAGVSESGFIVPASQGAPPWLGTSDVCTGRVEIYAWWEDLPSQIVPVALPIRAGDKVSVSIFEMSPRWWAVAVHDLTAGRAFFLCQPYAGPQASVQWVVEAPQLTGMFAEPVPFNRVSFSYLGANGQARELVRFSYGGKGKVAFSPSAAVNIAQLMRRGFQVRWVRPPGEVLPKGSPQRQG